MTLHSAVTLPDGHRQHPAIRMHGEERLDPVAQVKDLSKSSPLHAAEVGDRDVIVGVIDHGADRDDDEVDERVRYLSTVGIGKRSEMNLTLGAH
ncbi:MAG: hypothetical protein NTY17_01715 [Planctomycetia bacterium]|nr:hypothetical protein [Planctomycetia bacterium]